MCQHEGAAAPGLAGVGVEFAKALGGQVQRLGVAGQHDGQTACKGGVTDVVAVAVSLNGGIGGQVGEPQHVTQQGHQEVAHRELMRIKVGSLAQGRKIVPQALANFPEAGHLVTQLQALGDAVVRIGLLGSLGRLQGGQARQFGSGNQAANDLDGLVNQLGGVACHGCLKCRFKHCFACITQQTSLFYVFSMT